jgi:hypothetical protein
MKKISILVLIFALLTPTILTAQTVRFAYTFGQQTISSTATALTSTKVTSGSNQANVVVFTVNCASGTSCVLRFTIDGTTPTASLGLRALYGDTVSIIGYNNNKLFKGIRETSTDVIIDVVYLR